MAGNFFAVNLLKCFCSVVKLLSREVCQALLGQYLHTFLSISLENTLSRSSRIHSTASYSLGSPLISIKEYSVTEVWKWEPGIITDCSLKVLKFD